MHQFFQISFFQAPQYFVRAPTFTSMIGKRIFPLFMNMLIMGAVLAQSTDPVYETETLKINALSDKVFQHVSYFESETWGKVPCNGLIFINQGEAIIFDTPTGDGPSTELIKWIENIQKAQIKAIVATHFHEDCVGGLTTFRKQGIPSYAFSKTIDLLREKESSLIPDQAFPEKWNISIGDKSVLVRHFGEGHTSDNVVGHIPSENALFGGCLVKTMNASKGNLEDANVREWSATIAKIKEQYPNLQIIVPGHGKSGGMELLDYTYSLFLDQ